MEEEKVGKTITSREILVCAILSELVGLLILGLLLMMNVILGILK